MKRFFKCIFTVLLATCCCFLICCEYYPIQNESSSINGETSSEDFSSSEEPSDEDSSEHEETNDEDSSHNKVTCNHNYIWTTLKESSCTTHGIKMGMCSICLKIKFQGNPLLSHDYSEGAFCKLCDMIKTPDFYVPDNFNGGLTIKAIQNQVALLGASLYDLTQIEISSVYINHNGVVALSIDGRTINVPDLQCNYPAEETPSPRIINTLKIRETSQLNVYVIDSNNQETCIGSLDGTGKIERLFVNENNDVFVVYSHNAAVKIGTLNVNLTNGSSLLYRKIQGKEEYAVIGLLSEEEHVKIPDTLNGLPVTVIEDYAFDCVDCIKSVQIGKFVKTIGNWAFWKCSSLTTLYLPNSSLIIKAGAFYRTNLTTIYYEGNQATKKENLIFASFYSEPLFECDWIYNYKLSN